MTLLQRAICSVLSVTLILTPTLALAQSPAEGCDLYAEARFQEAIDLLEKLLIRGQLGEAETLEARTCLARAYVKAGQSDAARDVFVSILNAAPDWEPDPFVIPPDEIAVFQTARTERAVSLAETGTSGAPEAETPATEPTTQSAALIEEGAEDEGGNGKIVAILGGIVAVGLIVAGLLATE